MIKYWMTLIVTLCVVYTGIIEAKTADKHTQLKVTHVVLCWMEPTKNTTLKTDIIKASYRLKAIPEVISFQAGIPVKSDRDIVDDSFDMAFYMTFNSKKDMDAYIDNPIHQAFVNDYLNPYVRRLEVYDFSGNLVVKSKQLVKKSK